MRKVFRRLLPDDAALRRHRWLQPFGNTLLHPRLWHLNRHSAAGAVAVGLFCGLVPGPLQMLSAALCCVLLRVNLPLALVTTLYSNPFTIVPLYLLAYGLGQLFVGGGGFIAPPGRGGLTLDAWIGALWAWFIGLGTPLALGLLLLAVGLALLGYVVVRTAWRLHLIHAWRRRAAQRA